MRRQGQGITPHVDLAAFGDGVAGVSLGAAVVMDWRRVAANDDEGGSSSAPHVRVLLRPGDLMVMHGAARYAWTHGCGT
jgi:alkylated DNA repair dioxygenase AlkB